MSNVLKSLKLKVREPISSIFQSLDSGYKATLFAFLFYFAKLIFFCRENLMILSHLDEEFRKENSIAECGQFLRDFPAAGQH